MSYDLFFRSRRDLKLSRSDFERYFGQRPNYELNGKQACYSNDDSGVYFVFEYAEGNSNGEQEEPMDSSLLPISFNLNYYRPHIFGLEAEPELAAFVAHFDLTVSDPQMGGMGDGEYSKDGFLKGWNAGNDFGYLAILKNDRPQKILTMPSATIEVLWRWNYQRRARQEELGDRVFVPRIFFIDAGGMVRTTVAWADGIPILLPEVDFVIVPRQRLAPRRWFRSRQDIVVLEWSELEAILPRFPIVAGEINYYQLYYSATPADIERMIRQKPASDSISGGVTIDQILDRELVEKAIARGAG
jgi:hypothetical protein